MAEYIALPDSFIGSLFNGTNFGVPVNSSVDEQRKLIAKSLKNQLDGFWSGHTIYQIMVHGGFLIDAKSSEPKKLTALGNAFLESEKQKAVNS